MIREAIARVVAGEDLTREEASTVMEEIMTGEATAAQFGSLVTGLRLKGESVAEITGFASTMRRLATPLDRDQNRRRMPVPISLMSLKP